ncbi:LOW QUALITY PROTEIN: growth/differentiation factor 6-B-like [Bolinopsis microptera]|uniref:LOW QUALITY PROTEIN: growth/differentiation factor 6-B-like n=1 Tax=Bolinopsis microptera TaxID=2820187 RepID=UPI003078ADFF
MTSLQGSSRTLLCSFVIFLSSFTHLDCGGDNEVSAPDYLIELYNKFNRGVGEVEEEEENANKIFTFYRSGVTELEGFYLPQKAKLDFNISAFNREDRILASNLRVFVGDISESIPLTKEGSVTAVTLKTTCKTRIYDRSDVLLVKGRVWRHTKQLKKSDTGQWIKIKVSSIERTLNNLTPYRHFYHFVVRCSITTQLSHGYLDKYGGRTPIFSISRSKEPTLVVYTVNNSSKPFREYMRSNQEGRQAALGEGDQGVRASRGFQHRCVLMDLYLNFTKLGWGSKIIHPLELKINQCAGQCPYPMSHAIDHSTSALFRGAWYKKFPDSVARPCCVPSTYKPATLMLSGDHVTVLKKFDDLIVSKCKCL